MTCRDARLVVLVVLALSTAILVTTAALTKFRRACFFESRTFLHGSFV